MSDASLSEQTPLLVGDVPDEQASATRKSKLAGYLDSKWFHSLVIFLIAVDAACVLADLTYTFLSPSCGSPEEDSPLWLEVLSHISLSITTFFLIEIPLSLYAFGLRYYDPINGVPHASLHLFDAVVIVTTFVLEAVLRGREQELVGLLIILRLWRLVKLVGGIAVGAGEMTEELADEMDQLRKELERTKSEITRLEDENQQLKSCIPELEGSGQ